MTSSSHRRWTLNALGLRRGLPSAMSSSRFPRSSAAFSASCWTVSTNYRGSLERDMRTSFAFCSARSRLIFSSSRMSSAVSSSSSSLSSLLSLSWPSESASISLVSSNTRLLLASGSSSSGPSSPGVVSSRRFGPGVEEVVGASVMLLVFAKCAASAASSSARKSRGSVSASPPCPGCLHSGSASIAYQNIFGSQYEPDF
jgi:hypothetical protein